MKPITKEFLDRQVEILNRISGGDYEIGYAYGQARVEAAHGSRDISPRGTKREVSMYLRCMITAVQRYQDAEWKLAELNRRHLSAHKRIHGSA